MNILHRNLQNENGIKSRDKRQFNWTKQWLTEVTKKGKPVTGEQANKTGLSVGEN